MDRISDAFFFPVFGFVTGLCRRDVKYVLIRIIGPCFISGVNASDVETLLSRQTCEQEGNKI